MFEQENSPETATTQPEAEAHKPTLSELLQSSEPEGAEGEAGETHEKAEPKGKAKAKPKTLKDWAEQAGLEAKDLYAVEVPISEGGDAKPVSLGELKDAYAKQDDMTRRELDFAERVAKQEADWTRTQSELKALIQALPPKALSEQAIAMVRGRAEADLKTERDATLRAIPEWSDQTRRETELQGMVEHLQDYGFPPGYLQQGFNHRLVRFVRDSYLRKQRIEQALAGVKRVEKPSTTGKAKPSGVAKKPSAQSVVRGKGPEQRLMALLDE